MPDATGPGAGLSVLVTGVVQNSGLAIVRELGRAGFRVIGASATRLPFGLHSRYATAYHPAPTDLDPQHAERLLELVRRTRPDVFLPTGTPTVGAVCRRRSDFEKLTAVNVPDLEAFRTAQDNRATKESCRELGIPCPDVFGIREAQRRLEVSRGNPESRTVVVKPRSDCGGGRGVEYCRDATHLREAVERCRASWGEPFTEEYIPGGADAMRTVVVLFDRDSELMAYFTMRKIRQWPLDGGITAMAASTDDRDLVDQVLPFFRRWSWRGPAEVELKVDPRDGIAKLIEINPRFCNYIGFPGRCGLGIPTLAALAAAGRVRGRADSSYAVDVRYVNPVLYLKAVASRLHRSSPRAGELRRVWSEVSRGPISNSADPTDPLPRIGKHLFELMRILRRKGQTHGTRLQGP